MKLTDKTMLITGASSGIGEAVALRASKDKCTVILSARDEEKLNKVKEEVEKNGSKAIVIPADVTKHEDIKNLFLEATRENRVLDVVFNNAGLGFIGNIWELTAEEIQTMVNVNALGMILVTKYASEVMVRQKHGHIIMTSSLAGLISLPQWAVYAATKWAITGFADSIHFELKPHNINVTTLHPGAVKTDFFAKDKANIDVKDMGDAVDAEEVADAVYQAIFTNTQKILIPKMAKNYALIYRFLPKVVQKLIEKQAKDIEYHTNVEEDEPEFSYIKCVKCDSN
ncbi:SDR family NAD(P)-dependent oxidoreductase [Candidatus Dojkabacteria bacterium]|nr:SDR family NAD(P)-dependent oxidoreductase [Candidatus Dojkabacteria bacterium]